MAQSNDTRARLGLRLERGQGEHEAFDPRKAVVHGSFGAQLVEGAVVDHYEEIDGGEGVRQVPEPFFEVRFAKRLPPVELLQVRSA